MTLGKSTKFITAFGGVRGPDKWTPSSTTVSLFDNVIDGAYQTREEIEWLEQLLSEVKPRRVLEIGVARGGVSRLFCEAVGAEGHVVGLDISDELVADDVKRRPNYTLLVGDSHDPAVLSRVRSICDQYDLLLIDGDHSVAGVRQDTEWYVPLVKDGGVVLWHDVRLEPDVGIKTYWYGDLRRTLPGAGEFFVDTSNNGLGFWRKTGRTLADFFDEAAADLGRARPDEALKQLAIVAEADPYYPRLWPLWSEAAHAAGRADDAATALARAILLAPQDARLRDKVAALRPDVSSPLLLQAERLGVAQHGDPADAYERAMLGRELGLLDTAIADMHEALRLDPLNLEARRRLLEILMANNRAQREAMNVILSGVRADGRTSAAENAVFAHLADWVQHTLVKCFLMQRYAEMIDFAVLLRRESASFVPTCVEVIQRYVAHPRFQHVQAAIKTRAEDLPEASVFLLSA